MKVLVTAARAPVAMEWTRILRRQGMTVLLCDSLSYPLAAQVFKGDNEVSYKRVPSPVRDFDGYARRMIELIASVDVVIPTCEDIFFLSQLELSDSERDKCWMMDSELLLGLHHKQAVFQLLPADTAVRFPKTKLLTSSDDFDQAHLEDTILKPVYSRFGRQVLTQLKGVCLPAITPQSPWVQQEKLVGQSYCNFALCDRGRVVAHAVYEPQHLLNGSASTYFKQVSKPEIDEFVRAFAMKHHFHGQVAFDFIETAQGLYVIECNPRATSGLHLLAEGLAYKTGQWFYQPMQPLVDYSVGRLLYLVSGWSAIKQGKWSDLKQAVAHSRSVLSGLPFWGLTLSLAELYWISLRQGISLTDASTADFEFNGDDFIHR